MSEVKLKAEIREEVGSGESGRLRQKGWIPGVLYGPEMEGPVPIKVDLQELRRVLPEGHRGVVNLELKRGENIETYPVMFKELQRESIKGHILHLDLHQISLTRKVTLSAPVHLVGDAPGVKDGGVLQHQLWEVEIECLPHRIPDYLEADISELGINDVLTAGELPVPEGVEILTPADEAVVSVLAPTQEEEEPEVEEEGLEEGEAVGEGDAESPEAPAEEEE